MTKFVYTIWALLLNLMGISVFKTCFVDAVEDDYGDNLLSGPPITSHIFALGVYIITFNLELYPTSFRKPISILMGLYQFLATAFLIEFSVACIWTPIDVHIYTTLTQFIIKVLLHFGFNDAAARLLQNKYPMAVVCTAVSIGFLLTTLYTTKSIDFITNNNSGSGPFANQLNSSMLQRVAKELSSMDDLSCDGCHTRQRSRGRRRSRRA